MPPRKSSQTRWLSRIPRDLKRCRQHLEKHQYDCIKALLCGSTKEYRQSLFRRKELRGSLHKAISLTDLGLLRFLVNYCGAPIEVTNDKGLTPLYRAVFHNWVEGAVFLLDHGASIHNAEQSLNNASCVFPPLVHAAVLTGNQRLLSKVIRGGADINTLNWEGENCLEGCFYIATDLKRYIQKEMKKANLPQEESIPRTQQVAQEHSVYSCEDSALVEGLIPNQHSQDPTKTMLLRGAWHVAKGDYASAFACWKDLFDSLGNGDESIALSSAWTGIVHMNDRALLEGGRVSKKDELNFKSFALLIFAMYAPTNEKLPQPIRWMLFQLIDHDEKAAALDFMKHLLAVRPLYKHEVTLFVFMLNKILWNLIKEPEISFSLILDSVMIASKCLFFLTMDGSFSTSRGLTTRHDFSTDAYCCGLCSAVYGLIQVVLKTLSIYQQGVPASEEQLHWFFSHIRCIVCLFPWIRGENIFYYLQQNYNFFLLTSSSMKTLVELSAEARGFNRHENLPPHLSSNRDGNTPLHLYSRLLIPDFLIEEGLLQCFLDYGAHLCIRNNQGESVRDILVRRGLLPEAELVPSLQCLAAAAFMKVANVRKKVLVLRPKRVRQILLDH